MKKLTKTLLYAATAAALAMVAKPAQAQVSSGNAIVTLGVTDVLVLAVTNPAVPLNLASVTDFQNGTSYVATAHLTTSSNRPYDVKVKSDGDLQGQATASGTSIPISNVLVQAAPTTTTTYTSQLPLSSSDQVLISNAPAAMAKVYDVKYSVGTNNSAFYVKAGAYLATLTYTIVAH